MPYDPIVFVDEDEGVSGTDLNAAAFNHMEDGIVAATDLGENAATAAVVAALEARVEALETAPPPETEKVGAIKLWTKDAAPDGYLICDGTAVLRSTYAALFAEIGETFGAGNGSTTFNLPDLRGRTPVGKGTHADVDALGDSDGVALANRGPKHRHPHTHTMVAAQDTGSNSSMAKATSTNQSFATNSADAGPANSPIDTPAYLTVNFIIKT